MSAKFLLLLLAAALWPAGAAAAPAAGKAGADYKEIPEINWKLMPGAFKYVFDMRNNEIESAEPNRFFQGTVAFALGRMDDTGHFLMLNCGSSSACAGRRDALEDRMVYSTLLEVVRTPKVKKEQLYDLRTWELTPLGEKYLDKLRKRHPDLPGRLGRLVNYALSGR